MQYTKTYQLYKTTDFLGQKKSLTLTYDTDMKIDIHLDHVDGTKEHISTFNVSGIDEVAKNDIAQKEDSSKPKVTLSFELTRSALLQLNKAEAKVDETVVVEDKPANKTSSKSKNATNDTESSSSEENKPTEDQSDSENTSSESSEKTEEAPKKTKKKTHSYPLYKITREHYGEPTLTREQIQKAKDRLRQFEKRDEDKKRTDKAKNDFESVIYSMRDWLNEEENQGFVPGDEGEDLRSRLVKEEDWLMDEGDQAGLGEYVKRYTELNGKLQSYKTRKTEYNQREDAVSNAYTKLENFEEKLDDLKTKKPWITDDQKKDVRERLEETKDWLEQSVKKQKQTPLSQDPIFMVSEITTKLKRVEQVFTRVSNTPKPKPKFDNKNIKIDNITIDGNENVDWGDFIKINNGDDDIPDIDTMGGKFKKQQ